MSPCAGDSSYYAGVGEHAKEIPLHLRPDCPERILPVLHRPPHLRPGHFLQIQRHPAGGLPAHHQPGMCVLAYAMSNE